MAQTYSLKHGLSPESAFLTDTCWSAMASGHASHLKRVNLDHYRAAQDLAEVVGKTAKGGFALVVIFSREGYNLLVN